MIESDADTDRLVAALAAEVGAREARLRELWEPVLLGEALAEAAAEASAAAGFDEREIELARSLYAPYSESRTEALLDAVLGGADAAEDGGGASAGGGAEIEAANEGGGRWLLAGLLAVAAALLLWWLIPGSESSRSELAAVGSYSLEFADQGMAKTRSESADVVEHRYHGRTRYDWRLRPEVDVEGEIEARLFAIPEFGPGRELSVELAEIAPTGAVRWTGRAEELGLTAGRWTMIFVVGRPGRLPRDAAAAEETVDGEALQVERGVITIVE